MRTIHFVDRQGRVTSFPVLGYADGQVLIERRGDEAWVPVKGLRDRGYYNREVAERMAQGGRS